MSLITPICFLAASLLLPLAMAEAAETKAPVQSTRKNALPTPTHRNIVYGTHARNVLDIWLAKSDRPTPVLVHIHGGGWVNGDKSSLSPSVLAAMLEKGVSVASINYRYSTMAPLPAPVHDAARAIQFLRSKADEWNLRKDRFAAIGGSAGACTSLWLNYHDDLAKPASADPIERESSRLSAAVGLSGQTSIDPKVIVPWVGDEVMKHSMISRAVGAKDATVVMAKYDKYAELYREFSAINHVGPNDPPAMLLYQRQTPLPARNPGDAIHHAAFGKELKKAADRAGAKVILHIGKGNDSAVMTDFVLEELLR